MSPLPLRLTPMSQLMAKRVARSFRDYAARRADAMGKAYQKFKFPIDMLTTDTFEGPAVALLFDGTPIKALDDFTLPVAATGPFISGDPSGHFLVLSGTTAVDLKTITFEYLRLRAWTVQGDWFGAHVRPLRHQISRTHA